MERIRYNLTYFNFVSIGRVYTEKYEEFIYENVLCDVYDSGVVRFKFLMPDEDKLFMVSDVETLSDFDTMQLLFETVRELARENRGV